jgi:hypothetical protein
LSLRRRDRVGGAAQPQREPKRPSASARRINQLGAALSATRYLEIGVANGVTFRQVESPERTGVDPRFRFQTSRFEAPGVRFAEVTSDQFFAASDRDEAWDIVFIDGLHVFEQTYRDLCNTLLHTGPRAAILIDDTWPSDIFSTLRDQSAAYMQREAAKGASASRAWHGDVFKVVFAIHEFHTALDFATIAQGDHPQTLVWRSNDGRTPLGLSFEDISRLTYFDFLEHAAVFRPVSESEAIARCLSALT